MKNPYCQIEDKLKRMKQNYQQPELSPEQLETLQAKIKESAMENKRHKKNILKFTAVAAACVAAFIILPNLSVTIASAMEQIPILGSLVEVVTFRNYQYHDERHTADIDTPQLELQTQLANQQAQENLTKTMDEINAEIQEITDKITKEFEAYAQNEMGYQDVLVKSEVLSTAEDYFTLKLICYQGAGSGYEWDYFYTVNLTTGERMKLKDIFNDNADYITPISENIKKQMQEQMDADENIHYWLHDDIDEWNFKAINDETSFYLNEKGNVVICFNEGDVAPMYMGTVEFEIPAEVTKNIRK